MPYFPISSRQVVPFHCPVELNRLGSTAILVPKTACCQQCRTNIVPPIFRQGTYNWAQPAPLCQRDVIEIQSAHGRHPVLNSQGNLRTESPYCPCCRRHDDLV